MRNLVALKTLDLGIVYLGSAGHLVSCGLNVSGYDQPKVEVKKKPGLSEGGTLWCQSSYGTSTCMAFHSYPLPKLFTIHVQVQEIAILFWYEGSYTFVYWNRGQEGNVGRYTTRAQQI